jgi:hypothetical protein
MNKTFDTCPRCHNEWQPLTRPRTQISAEIAYDGNDPKIVKEMFKCPQCGMKYSADKNDEHQLAMQNFLGQIGFHLGWNTKKECCFYGTLDQLVYDQGVKLPWLPFTITPQQLTDILSKPVMIHHLTPQEAAGINEIDEEGSKVLNDILSENK